MLANKNRLRPQITDPNSLAPASVWCLEQVLHLQDTRIYGNEADPCRKPSSSSSRAAGRSEGRPDSGALIVSTITGTPLESPWPLYRLSVDQYEAMVESGILTERDKLQLINGMLVAKVTQGDDHCVADDLCRVELSAVLPPGWFVRPNKPVRLPPDSEPEPDEAVVRGSIRDYERGNAGSPAADVGLVVEVAYSSLDEDREMVLVYGPKPASPSIGS